MIFECERMMFNGMLITLVQPFSSLKQLGASSVVTGKTIVHMGNQAVVLKKTSYDDFVELWKKSMLDEFENVLKDE